MFKTSHHDRCFYKEHFGINRIVRRSEESTLEALFVLIWPSKSEDGSCIIIAQAQHSCNMYMSMSALLTLITSCRFFNRSFLIILRFHVYICEYCWVLKDFNVDFFCMFLLFILVFCT